jgi:hypothetical protein
VVDEERGSLVLKVSARPGLDTQKVTRSELRALFSSN